MLSSALASSAQELTGGEELSTPRSSEQHLLMFLINPRYNAYLWGRPEIFPSLVDRMSEPGFIVGTMNSVIQPEPYFHFVKGFTDLEKMRSYFELLDPMVIRNWAAAVASPASWLALYGHMSEPAKWRNWMAFATGAHWPEMLRPISDRQTYAAWMTLPINPETYRQLQGPLRMANPWQPLIVMGVMTNSGVQAVQRFTSPVDSTTPP